MKPLDVVQKSRDLNVPFLLGMISCLSAGTGTRAFEQISQKSTLGGPGLQQGYQLPRRQSLGTLARFLGFEGLPTEVPPAK